MNPVPNCCCVSQESASINHHNSSATYMAAELGPPARVRVSVRWYGYRRFSGLVQRRAGPVRRRAGPARTHSSASSYCTLSVTCEAEAPPAAAALPLLMSCSFHRCSSSARVFGRRWPRCSAATAKRRVLHTSSVMLLSVRTGFDCRTLLNGSIQNTSSTRSREPFPKTKTEDVVPFCASLKNCVSDLLVRLEQ